MLKSMMTLNEDAIESFIVEKIKEVSTPVIVFQVKDKTGEKKVEITGVHQDFKKLLYLVDKGHHVYLWGPPGSGKSTAAYQCAQSLARSYGYISLNPQTPDSRILGYMDAGGNYRKTTFSDCYINGGVFCIDEMDNASPSLLTTLNSLLENGHGAFPHGIFKRHPGFVLIATGNTAGRGANAMFPERRAFDSAFSERFTFLEWTYDVDMEKAITLQINNKALRWYKWVQKARKYCLVNYPRVLISPRVSYKGADYLKDKELTVSEIVEMLVFKGLDAATKAEIITKNPLPSLDSEQKPTEVTPEEVPF